MKAIENGIQIVKQLAEIAVADKRETRPASDLILGLQCGGSDAWSGVSCNPSLGRAADLLLAAGGAVILAETPEIYGAEQLLISRAASSEVAAKLIGRLRWWEDYLSKHGETLNNNPSPGNIEDGISTILEKSLGAVAKAGTSRLSGVLEYAEPTTGSGLYFMDSPGYDPCSVTGEIASGANIICFTTGRVSVFGAKPVPSMKLASNAALARSMEDDIDVDCSSVIEGSQTVQTMGEIVFEALLDIASGKQSKSEALGFGELEFVPWQLGAYL